MNINCLIIDDEPLAINVIKSYIEEIDTITILNTFSNAIDALTYLKEHSSRYECGNIAHHSYSYQKWQ